MSSLHASDFQASAGSSGKRVTGSDAANVQRRRFSSQGKTTGGISDNSSVKISGNSSQISSHGALHNTLHEASGSESFGASHGASQNDPRAITRWFNAVARQEHRPRTSNFTLGDFCSHKLRSLEMDGEFGVKLRRAQRAIFVLALGVVLTALAVDARPITRPIAQRVTKTATVTSVLHTVQHTVRQAATLSR
jgi:hypothetical protein